jgi:hypothetical protein
MSVCSLRYPACNANAPYWYLQTMRLYYIFPHYLKTARFSKKKNIRRKMCFDFLYKFLWNISEFKKNLARYNHKCILVILVRFYRNLIFSTDFRKIFKYKISWKFIQWEPSCCVRAVGRRQTDRHDETNCRFSQFLWTRPWTVHVWSFIQHKNITNYLIH